MRNKYKVMLDRPMLNAGRADIKDLGYDPCTRPAGELIRPGTIELLQEHINSGERLWEAWYRSTADLRPGCYELTDSFLRAITHLTIAGEVLAVSDVRCAWRRVMDSRKPQDPDSKFQPRQPSPAELRLDRNARRLDRLMFICAVELDRELKERDGIISPIGYLGERRSERLRLARHLCDVALNFWLDEHSYSAYPETRWWYKARAKYVRHLVAEETEYAKLDEQEADSLEATMKKYRPDLVGELPSRGGQ